MLIIIYPATERYSLQEKNGIMILLGNVTIISMVWEGAVFARFKTLEVADSDTFSSVIFCSDYDGGMSGSVQPSHFGFKLWSFDIMRTKFVFHLLGFNRVTTAYVLKTRHVSFVSN